MTVAADGLRHRLSGGMADTFRSMRIRNFRLFFAGQVVSQIGNWITRVGLTLLVLRLTNSGIAVGFVVACEFLPMLLFGAWAGVVVDRSDKRRLLIIVQLLAMLQSFVLALLAFLPNPPLLALYAAALAGGLTTVFDFPGRRAFVLQMVPQRDVPNAVSLNTALMNLARVIGPAVAGLLVTTVGYGWSFTLDAVSYVAVLVGLWMIRPSELRAAPRAVKEKGQVRAGLSYAKSKSTLWIPLVVMAIVGTLTYNFGVVLPLLAERTFHGGEATFTALYSALSVGSLVGALAAARRTTVTLRTVCITCSLFGATMLAFALAPTLLWAFPAVLLVGWASTFFMTAGSAIVQLDTSAEMQGRIGALQSITLVGSTPIGSPIVGWVCERFGARAGLALGGVAAFVAAAWGAAAGPAAPTSRIELVDLVDDVVVVAGRRGVMSVARLFVAALLPPPILDLLATLPRPEEPGVRYTRNDQWHVTLRFLGSCSVDDATRAFDTIEANRCEAELGPSVARLGRSVVVVPVDGLQPLAAAVLGATREIGEPPDPRPFNGHITIARLRDRPACRVAGHRIRATFTVDDVHLVRSDLRRDGAVYETIATRQLR